MFVGLGKIQAEIGLVEDFQGELFESELAAISNARSKRREEFIAGRVLARELLLDCGLESQSLRKCISGAVIWPENIVGSISHSGGCVAVAVGQRCNFRSIGFDIEVNYSVTQDMISDVLTLDEIQRVGRNSLTDIATLLFSCKESVYKAVSPLVGEFLEFKDVSIYLRDSTFSARCVDNRESGEFIAIGDGHFDIDQRFVKTLFVIDR